MAEDVATRAATWRDASQRERAAAFAGLVRIAEYGARHRPKPYAKPPLKFPRFSSLKPHDAAR